MALLEGWNVFYLGTNLPAEEIAGAVHKTKAKALALSLVYPGRDSKLKIELKKLKTLLPPKTYLVCGGQKAISYQKAIQDIGGTIIKNLGEFQNYLENLRSIF